ncbi:MAG TPA: molybdopterin dinucleotide binding domain-containing protein, partial [Blastocatellia bacterium]|nr:molybdopterin dinucleotide binding domain-containing protein [Blastocatellia bacterium]
RAVRGLPLKGGSFEAESVEKFWEELLKRGVWSGKVETGREARPATPSHPIAEPVYEAAENASPEQYPLVLLAYEHGALGSGREANLPLLQELPDPMTSVMWGSWVEINPKTAASLGIADGDLVEVQTAHGSVRAPAVCYPAIRPDCIAMPTGQGHTAFGRFARGRGANAALLDPYSLSDHAPVTIRARVSKVSARAKLARFGTSLPEHLEIER